MFGEISKTGPGISKSKLPCYRGFSVPATQRHMEHHGTENDTAKKEQNKDLFPVYTGWWHPAPVMEDNFSVHLHHDSTIPGSHMQDLARINSSDCVWFYSKASGYDF